MLTRLIFTEVTHPLISDGAHFVRCETKGASALPSDRQEQCPFLLNEDNSYREGFFSVLQMDRCL